MYEEGVGTPIDYKKAFEFYKKGCDLNDGYGCFSLGYMYQHQEGVPKDLKKAKDFYEKGCKLGYGKSCEYLKRFVNF
jgi:TPR repeat protein